MKVSKKNSLKQIVHRHYMDIIIICILLLAAVSFFIYNGITSKEGGRVIVYSDQKMIHTYSLNTNGTYEIVTDYGTNVIEIKSGKVAVISASCKNQICVHHAAIHTTNESIICLPNHLVVTVECDNSNGRSDVDDIAK